MTLFDRLLKEAVTRTPPGVMDSWIGKVHAGDCVELMAKMPVGSIDVIVTSPPLQYQEQHGQRSQEWEWWQMAPGRSYRGVRSP